MLHFLKHASDQTVSFNWNGPGPKWYGPAALTLNGNNTFSSPIQMVGGTLRAGEPGCFGQDGLALTIPAGVTLDAGSGWTPLNYPLVLGGTLTSTDTEAAYGLATKFPTVSLSSDSVVAVTSAPMVVGGLDINTSGITFNGHALTKTGLGTLYLNNLSSYGSGKLDVRQGSVEGTSTNNASGYQFALNTIDVNVAEGATIVCPPVLSWVGKTLTGNGTVQVAGGSHETYIGGTSENFVFGGSFAGGDAGGRLRKSGSGTATFAGDNSQLYSKLYVAQGAIQYANANSLGSPTGGSGTSAPIQFVGGKLQQTSVCTWPLGLTVNVWGGYGGTWDFSGLPASSTQSIPAAIGCGGTTNIITAANRTVQFQGVVSGAGTMNVSGAGTISIAPATALASVLTGTNSFSGTYSVSTGNLVFSSTGSEDGLPSLNITSGRVLLADPFAGGTATFGNLSGVGGSVSTAYGSVAGTRTLSVNQSVDGTFAGTLVESGTRVLGLLKTGSASLTLSGSNAYTGGTTITGGTLKLGHANGIGVNGAYARGFTLKSGTFDINGKTNFTPGGGTAVWLINGQSITFGGVAGVSELKNSGATAGFGTFNLQNCIFYDATNNPGTATISAGWAAVGTSTPVTKTITVGDSTATDVELDITGTIGQPASGDGQTCTIEKTGAGTMRISAANNFPGIVITAGTLISNHAQALGAVRAVDNTVTVNSGGTLTYTVDSTGTRTVTANAGGVVNRGAFAHTGTTFVNNGGTFNPPL